MRNRPGHLSPDGAERLVDNATHPDTTDQHEAVPRMTWTPPDAFDRSGGA